MKHLFNTVKGDLLESHGGFIIHGCNDKGVMGSGVAAGIKKRYPLAFEVYRAAYDAGLLKIGTCTFYQHHDYSYVNKSKWIVNAVTQTLGGPSPLCYPAIKECFASTLNFMIALEAAQGVPFGSTPLMFPMIGAGRAGGDWRLIAAMIDDALDVANKAYLDPGQTRPAILYTVDAEPADCR